MTKYLPNAESFFFPGYRVDTVTALPAPSAIVSRPIPLFRISSFLSQTPSHVDKKTKPKRAASSFSPCVLTGISSR